MMNCLMFEFMCIVYIEEYLFEVIKTIFNDFGCAQ